MDYFIIFVIFLIIIKKHREIDLKTILEVIKLGTEYLKEKSIESPRLNIELIVCSVLKIKRIELYTQYDRPFTEFEIDTIRQMMLRRSNHEPIQYITGETQFMDLILKVNPSVLIPRPETEQLVEKVLMDYPDRDKSYNILDIGTGSGCIALSLAKYFRNSEIIAADISSQAIETAKHNAQINNIENIKFFEFDILNKIPKTKFDIICSNPPYISDIEYNSLEPELQNYEPKISLTDHDDGLTFYKRFAKIFPTMLNTNSYFYLELGYGQYPAVTEIFSVTKCSLDVSYDLSGIERVLRGRY